MLNRLLNHWGFAISLYLLILVGGFAELVEYLGEENDTQSTYWSYGLLIFALIKFLHCVVLIMQTVIKSIIVAEEFGESVKRDFSIICKANRLFRNPVLEMTLSVAIIVLCIVEEIINSQMGVKPHHGLMIFGIYKAMNVFYILWESIEIADDSTKSV